MAYSDTIRKYEQRRERIKALRARGWSLQRIADKYSISKARVGQLLKVSPWQDERLR